MLQSKHNLFLLALLPVLTAAETRGGSRTGPSTENAPLHSEASSGNSNLSDAESDAISIDEHQDKLISLFFLNLLKQTDSKLAPHLEICPNKIDLDKLENILDVIKEKYQEQGKQNVFERIKNRFPSNLQRQFQEIQASTIGKKIISKILLSDSDESKNKLLKNILDHTDLKEVFNSILKNLLIISKGEELVHYTKPSSEELAKLRKIGNKKISEGIMRAGLIVFTKQKSSKYVAKNAVETRSGRHFKYDGKYYTVAKANMNEFIDTYFVQPITKKKVEELPDKDRETVKYLLKIITRKKKKPISLFNNNKEGTVEELIESYTQADAERIGLKILQHEKAFLEQEDQILLISVNKSPCNDCREKLRKLAEIYSKLNFGFIFNERYNDIFNKNEEEKNLISFIREHKSRIGKLEFDSDNNVTSFVPLQEDESVEDYIKSCMVSVQ